MYKFKIENIKINTVEGQLDIIPKKINIIIGPNNSGKSRMLKELRDFLCGDRRDIKIIKDLSFEYPASLDDIDESYGIRKKMSKDMYGNWFFHSYLNKMDNAWDMNASMETLHTKSFQSFSENWEEEFCMVIDNKDLNSFLHCFGTLFLQYLGTEERLTICKTQKNYGIDGNNSNYLTAYKFETKLIQDLRDNLKKLFQKDIFLDYLSLGDRLAFRVGKDFSYIEDYLKNSEENIHRLFEESLLDNQGDGLKSYVSTFLALNSKEKDVLLLDEPEAFLHPPLARQIGELIGVTDTGEKQIFISTHSVEILKGILSKNPDVNILRITQPDDNINRVCVIKPEIIKKILETPLLRVSRIMEGLFCEKVIITEAEADELIYQEIIEKIYPQSGLYFAHGQNKQTLAEIAELYKNIGIGYEVITDFDILRKNDEFNKFLKNMEIDEAKKQLYRAVIIDARNVIDKDVCIDGLSKEEAEAALKKHRDMVYHEKGKSYFANTDLEEKLEEVLGEMHKQHLHILETGELETLLVPHGLSYTHNKAHWVVEAINMISAMKAENLNSKGLVCSFIESVIGK